MAYHPIDWVDLFWIGVASFAFSCLLIKPISATMLRAGWVDMPGGRKRHVGAVPLAGGVVIVLSMTLTSVLVGQWSFPRGLAIGSLLLLVVGALDDHRPVRARYRFLVQLTAVAVIMLADGVLLQHLGALVGPFRLELGWLAVPFTVFAAIGMINAVNMTDGADGLAGGLVVVALFWFFVVCVLQAASGPAASASLLPLIVCAVGALGGFLVFNARSPWRARAAVFLGDGGSTALGLLVAWLAIYTTNGGGQKLPPAAALWIVAVPLSDALSAIFRRWKDGERVMAPDRRHVHHLLEQAGLSTAVTVGTLHAVAFVLGGLGVAGWRLGLPEWLMFAAGLGIFASYHFAAVRFWRARGTELEPPLPDAGSVGLAPDSARRASLNVLNR